MDVETMVAMRRKRRLSGSAWNTRQVEGYRNWVSVMSRSESRPYVTAAAVSAR
jgi:hypothetical protein